MAQISSWSLAAAAKSVGGTDEDVVAFVLDTLSELADGGGLADAVDTDDHQDVGLDRLVDGAFVGDTAFGRMVQDVEQLLPHRLFQGVKIVDLLTRNAAPDAIEDLHCRRDADIRRDKHLFEFIEKGFVDLLSAFEYRVEPVIDRVAGLLDGL